MPTINVTFEVSQEVYDRLERRAADRKRTLAEEVAEVVNESTKEGKETPVRLPEYIEPQEIDPPIELPRPGTPRRVGYVKGDKRLPDPPIILAEDR